jgi:hypothetical protein
MLIWDTLGQRLNPSEPQRILDLTPLPLPHAGSICSTLYREDLSPNAAAMLRCERGFQPLLNGLQDSDGHEDANNQIV